MYGFDKPIGERFCMMMGATWCFDFGDSFFRNRRVVDLVIDKMPVSISLGLWTTLLIYLISIPLGIAKAVRDGSRFDIWTSRASSSSLTPSRASCSPSCWSCCSPAAATVEWFPLRGLVSDDWAQLSLADTDRSTISGTWCCRSPPW